jgi:hypothetical protein
MYSHAHTLTVTILVVQFEECNLVFHRLVIWNYCACHQHLCGRVCVCVCGNVCACVDRQIHKTHIKMQHGHSWLRFPGIAAPVDEYQATNYIFFASVQNFTYVYGLA